MIFSIALAAQASGQVIAVDSTQTLVSMLILFGWLTELVMDSKAKPAGNERACCF